MKERTTELILGKVVHTRWKVLEQPKHHPQGIPSSGEAISNQLSSLSVSSNPRGSQFAPGTSPQGIASRELQTQERQQPNNMTGTDQSSSFVSSSHNLRGGGQGQRSYDYSGQTVRSSPSYPSTSYPTFIDLAPVELSNPSYRQDQLCKPSLTGLENVGNTCFMNSVIQCLSNTSEIRDYFIEGRYLADINQSNPLGFKGELAKCFCQILRKLWSGEYDYFQPRKLKTIIARRSSHFSGYSQHDSHEFLSYLLDGLHEDLNRIQSKPHTEPLEPEGLSDPEIAAKSWELHCLRNDSFFVDLFQGQFKSTLVCPSCSKVGSLYIPYAVCTTSLKAFGRYCPETYAFSH